MKRYTLPLMTSVLCLWVGVFTASASASVAQVSSWGLNSNGQLGIGTVLGPEACALGEACSTIPVQPSGLESVKALAAGAFHSLAVTGSGTVMAWGFNGSGQLGQSSSLETDTPAAVEGLSGVVAVAAGHEFSLALLSNGTVMAWGENAFGQLGNANHSSSPTPQEVQRLSGVKAIAAGANFSLALLSDGTVISWGAGSAGQLGDGQSVGSDIPVAVSGLSGVASISAGQNHSLARLVGGTVMAWGEDDEGQLGNARTANSNTPVAVNGLSGIAAVAAGGAHSMALTSAGQVMAWGENTQGELGNGTTTSTGTPLAVSGLGAITQIAAGYFNSFAVGSSGAVWAWGYGGNGQLGVGGTEDSHVPVAVGGLGAIRSIAAGQYDSLALGASVPAVSAITPTSGPAGGGTSVTITGSELSEAGRVAFGASMAPSFTVLSATSIRAVSPAGAGTVDVTVTTPSGTSATGPGDRFTYQSSRRAPQVTAISPSQGPAAGATTVTISGTGLEEATAVHFGPSAAAGFTVNSPSSITATSPAGTGTVDVTVTGPGGSSETSAEDRFTFVGGGTAAPTVKKLAPNKGISAGGTSVTITGTNLSTASGVSFAGVPARSFEVLGAGKIRAVSPPGVTGPVDVTVTGPAGTSATVAKDMFTYGAPSVTAVSPSSGPRAGGTAITVTGSGFAPGSATLFKLGNFAAASSSCSSSTTCTVLTPSSRKAASVDVRATVDKLTSSTNAPADRFTYN